MMHRTEATHGAAADIAAPLNLHAWNPTQAARIVQVLEAGQVADGGWQLAGELIVVQIPANHVGKGV